MQYKAEAGAGRVRLINRDHTCSRQLEHSKWKKKPQKNPTPKSTVPSKKKEKIKKGNKQLSNHFQIYNIGFSSVYVIGRRKNLSFKP